MSPRRQLDGQRIAAIRPLVARLVFDAFLCVGPTFPLFLVGLPGASRSPQNRLVVEETSPLNPSREH